MFHKKTASIVAFIRMQQCLLFKDFDLPVDGSDDPEETMFRESIFYLFI